MADHLIDIVNERDEVIGKEFKSKKPELGFISRAIGVFVRNSQGKFIITKRALTKKISPGKEDLSACGNVNAGEDYEQAAKRELLEETGIECALNLLVNFYEEVDSQNIDSKKLKYFCSVFLGETDKEPQFNDEIMSFRRLSKEEIEKEIKETPEKFCHGFINDFNRVKNKI